MKHTIEQKHIYEPMEGLKIEIEHNGNWYIYHQVDIVDTGDFNWNDPEDRTILVAIAEVIQYHNKHVFSVQASQAMENHLKGK
jgi:hypothetical protein